MVTVISLLILPLIQFNLNLTRVALLENGGDFMSIRKVYDELCDKYNSDYAITVLCLVLAMSRTDVEKLVK